MEHWVWNGRVIGFERFEQESEPFVVRRDESRESGDFLEGRVFVDAGELEGSDEGRESFGAEPCRKYRLAPSPNH